VNDAPELLGWWWKELAITPVPYYSINLHEVTDEHFDALVNNIQTQQVGMTLSLDKGFTKVFHFSVQSYDGTKRVLWINRFVKSPAPLPDPDEIDVESTVESVAAGRAWFRLFKGLAEFSTAYDWWTVQELDKANLFAENGDAGTPQPVVLDRLERAPTRLPAASDLGEEWPHRQIVELQATPLPCYSVSVIDVSPDNYDRVLANIKNQQGGLCSVLGEQYRVPHIYGANRYASQVRILWINKLEGNPEAVAAAMRANEAPWNELVAPDASRPRRQR